MHDLFRRFEQAELEYLLIGGQAAILYGAAHFTSDLDLWIRPTANNVRALLRVLAARHGRVHKLTPPLSLRWIRRGHGFHFVIPLGRSDSLYLDVMGKPPRVGQFAAAARRSNSMRTPWGALPVVAIEDLVELKKTNRPGDYEVISRLARLRLARERSPGRALVGWAVGNVFRAEDLVAIVERFADQIPPAAVAIDPALGRLLAIRARVKEPTARDLAVVSRMLDARIVEHMRAGRQYWVPRIEDLRRLRRDSRLLPEGTPVVELLGT